MSLSLGQLSLLAATSKGTYHAAADRIEKPPKLAWPASQWFRAQGRLQARVQRPGELQGVPLPQHW